MSNRSKEVGTWTETAVVKYLRNNGFPHAERRSLKGGKDQGDIITVPGLVIEVKGGAAAERCEDAWLARMMGQLTTEMDNASADMGLLVCKRRGVGETRVGDWWAWGWTWPVSGIKSGLGDWGAYLFDSGHEPMSFPVRMRVGDAIYALRKFGWGEPLSA